MPRYIDADKMLRFLTEHNDEKDLMVSRYNADWIISFIETQPAADVVPRSEVEEIFTELEFEIAQLDFDSAETRAIAIEGIIAALKKEYTERSDDLSRNAGCLQRQS